MAETYLTIGDDPAHKITVWWQESQPDRVHVTTGDPRFVDGEGGKPGLRVVISSNPKSADYNPSNFNRVARALRDAGISAPDDVPLHRRHIAERHAVIASVAADAPEPADED
jgi:hypothetical protein